MISLKAVMIFPKNFLDFGLDMFGKLGIVNLRNYSSKNYTSVVLCDFKVAFFEERKEVKSNKQFPGLI